MRRDWKLDAAEERKDRIEAQVRVAGLHRTLQLTLNDLKQLERHTRMLEERVEASLGPLQSRPSLPRREDTVVVATITLPRPLPTEPAHRGGRGSSTPTQEGPHG